MLPMHGSACHTEQCITAPRLSSARYKVAITKHKDSEQTSSSLYSQNDIWTPAVDFSKFIEDNESIEDEVCFDVICMLKYLYDVNSQRKQTSYKLSKSIYVSAGPCCMGDNWFPSYPSC